MAYPRRVDGATAVTREALEELRAKYSEMLDMRIVHRGPAEVASEARERMARLAARFPGSLRELDELPLEVIRGRIEHLEGVLRGEVEGEPWVAAVALFHSLTRGALCAKRWLEGRKRVDAAVERDFAAVVAGMAFPQDARVWAGDLARVARPPRGRLVDLVVARIAASLGTSESGARQLVFGPHQRARK